MLSLSMLTRVYIMYAYIKILLIHKYVLALTKRGNDSNLFISKNDAKHLCCSREKVITF